MEGRWQDLMDERQKSCVEAVHVQYDRETPFATVLAYMEAHRDRTHTYNEVVKGIKINGCIYTQKSLSSFLITGIYIVL